MINPCDQCPLKEGYGAEARCANCELTFLREENERLKHKIDKDQIRSEYIKNFIKTVKSGELPEDKSEFGLEKRT